MERTDLKLVPPLASPERSADPRERACALALAAAVLAAAAAATWLGAGGARRPLDTVGVATGAANRLLESGGDSPAVRSALLDLRAAIGRRPLDAWTRAVYAGLLLEVGLGTDRVRAAVFHANRAAALAPVTVPVVRGAATVLARSGEEEGALALVRAMFVYDPKSAAALLASVEPWVDRNLVPGAIPESPPARLEWVSALRGQGRTEEADEVLDDAGRRWPEDPDVLARSAGRALERREWQRLLQLVPADRDLTRDRAGALLLAFRSRARAATGDPAGAKRDAEEALRRDDGSVSVLYQAGIALDETGDASRARDLFRQAHRLAARGEDGRRFRVELLARIARIEDRVGLPADALRAWRAVLEEDPSHAEAIRRTDDLTGFHR